MTYQSKRQTSHMPRQYTVDEIPIAFQRKYVVFRRYISKPRENLPIIGMAVADNKTLARQHVVRERHLDEKFLFILRFNEATSEEKREAEEKQDEWEAQQKADIVQELDDLEISERGETLRNLYDRTVKTLRKEGYLE